MDNQELHQVQRWNLAYAYTYAYADLLWEENIVRLLKSATKVVL